MEFTSQKTGRIEATGAFTERVSFDRLCLLEGYNFLWLAYGAARRRSVTASPSEGAADSAMFTGLVEGRGLVTGMVTEGPAVRVEIEPPSSISAGASAIGDSISISGCCLTIVAVEQGRWSFEAGEETLSKTVLGDLDVGGHVNLERSLPVNGRLGGHFVQGHVDGTGTVDEIIRDGEWITMWFRVPAELAQLMVPKGSVAVDGISLTLVDVQPDRFSVALIPHTLEVTTLGVRNIGDRVNIETDILGKYVQKLLKGEKEDAW
jgi:riboflavin synthase